MAHVSSPQQRMLALAGVILLVAGAGLAWRECKKGESDELTTTPTVTELPPVPAPEALLADVVVGSPNASWSRLQRTIGGALGILPSTAGGIVCLGLGLDPLLASEIDGVSPAFGVVAGDPASPHWLFALKLAELRKTRATLVDGDTARFASREDAGITELLPKGQMNLPPGVVLGISSTGHLLVAHAEEDLAKLAPYVTRSLAKRPLPSEGAATIDMPRAALATLVRPRLEEQWTDLKGFLLAEDERMRRSHGGRAPDFGDPKVIVAALDGWVKTRIGIVSDLDRLHLVFDVTDDGLALTSTLSPQASGPAADWANALVVGDTQDLGALPASAAIALSLRDSEADRQAQADGAEKLVTDALGTRLPEEDRSRLHAAASDFTKARGAVLTAAVVWDEPQGLALRAPVRDSDAAAKAAHEALDLLGSKPFQQLLRAKSVTTKTEDAPNLGKVQIATIQREPRADREKEKPHGDAGAPGAPRSEDLGVGWLVAGGALTVGTGELPLFTLGSVVHPERKLADELVVSRSLAALGTNVNAVLVAQPLRFDPLRANLQTAPLIIALSRKDKDAVVRIEIANLLLRALAHWQLGL